MSFSAPAPTAVSSKPFAARATGRAALIGVALLAAGCATAPETVVSNTAPPPPPSTTGQGELDPTSIQYFEVTVGDRVFFPTDQSTLTDDARSVLSRQAQWLSQNASRVIIEGHADERGTREYNIALGARRADAVRSYLISQGVDASRISTVSFGRERPVEVCSNDACWARNRRAVTVVQQ